MFNISYLPLRQAKKALQVNAMRRRALLVPIVVLLGIGVLTHVLLVFHVINTAGPLNAPLPEDARKPPNPLPVELRKSLENRRFMNAVLKPRFIPKTGVLERHQGRISFDEQPDYVNAEGKGKSVSFRCKSCSLVGNTGLLLQSGLGKNIDKSDCVFRLGWAPTDQHEHDVGKKTTARILDFNSFIGLYEDYLHLLRNTEHLFVYDDEALRETSAAEVALQKASKSMSAEIYRFSSFGLNRAGLKLAEEKKFLRLSGEFERISSIWFAFLIMEDTHCNSIKMYSVPGLNYCRTHSMGYIPSRYWNLHSQSICGPNKDGWGDPDEPTTLEKQVIRGFSILYNITFHEPSWIR